MKNKRALILCAGQATRFNGVVKQLLPLYDGETILGRILHQLQERGFGKQEIFIIIAPNSEEIYNRFRRWDNKDFMFGVSRINLGNSHTALMTKDLWVDQNFILLGDVIYSQDTLDEILSCDKEIAFFGDLWETYAVEFTNQAFAEKAFKRGNLSCHRKLRHAYRGFINKEFDRKETIKLLREEPYFEYIDCWITRDCDSYSVYSNILKELIYNGVLEKDVYLG